MNTTTAIATTIAATVLIAAAAAQTPSTAPPPTAPQQATPAGQQPPGRGGRGAPALPPLTPNPSRVLAPGAVIEKIAGDFGFTEGPTTDKDGNVYFVDQNNNKIMKYDTSGNLTTFMQPSGYANGMCFDNQGHLIAAADEKNEMWSIDVATKKVTVLFSTYEGKMLNGPNDVWVHPTTGRIYFTDPYFVRNWWNRGPSENQETVYMYSLEDKKVVKLDDEGVKVNGIIGTPDGRTLYVADGGQRKTFAYDIAADGRLTNKRLFVESGSDGMTIDSEGNVYFSSGGVQVYTKTGERIETITPPENPANLVFGGKDRQTLFMTARTGFYAVRTRVKGVGPQ